MKCPYCDMEMELGYIQCRDGVYWNDKKRIVAAIPPMGGIKLSSNETPFGATASAYCCPKCKKIIIDYGAGE